MPQSSLIIIGALTVPQIVGIVVLSSLALVVLSGLPFMAVVGYIVFKSIFKRTTPEKWGRNMDLVAPHQMNMYAEGFAWRDANIDKMQEVQIENEGLKLCAQYFDFGSSSCVIVLHGRPDSLEYGYFYAIPYAQAGMNALLIDIRSHGNSDGEYVSTGAPEGRDIIAWAHLLHDKFGIEKVVLHGVCYGASGGMYAITDDKCPDCIKGIVADGMFINFGESFKNHLVEKKKPQFIVYPVIRGLVKKHTGHSLDKGPADLIGRLQKPILMIHSREDIYSLPEDAQGMYDACPSNAKVLSWHEHGKHSMLRDTSKEQYDRAIHDFLKKYIL